MRRVYIMGTSGAGKSTLARKLAEQIDASPIEIDGIYHQPNWTPLADSEFRSRVGDLVQGERWVIDGNYSKVRDLIVGRADTLVLLDYEKPVVLWRLFRRTLRRGLLRQELWNGNRESVRYWLSRDPEINIMLWAWTTFARRREQMREMLGDAEFAHLQRVHLRSPKETAQWLAAL